MNFFYVPEFKKISNTKQQGSICEYMIQVCNTFSHWLKLHCVLPSRFKKVINIFYSLLDVQMGIRVQKYTCTYNTYMYTLCTCITYVHVYLCGIERVYMSVYVCTCVHVYMCLHFCLKKVPPLIREYRKIFCDDHDPTTPPPHHPPPILHSTFSALSRNSQSVQA